MSSTPPQTSEEFTPDVDYFDESNDRTNDATWDALDKALAQEGPLDPTSGRPSDVPPEVSEGARDEPGSEAKEPEAQNQAEAEPEPGEDKPDYDVMVDWHPMGAASAQKISLGELKDIAQGTHQRIRDRELGLLQKERNIDDLVQSVTLTEDQQGQLGKYKEIKQQRVQRDMMLVQQAHPEWSDESLKVRELGAMRDVALRYGKSEEWVRTLSDPAEVEMLLDLTRLHADRVRAESIVKQVKQAAKLPRGETRSPRQGQSRRDSVDKIFGDAQQTAKDHNGEVRHDVWSRLDKLL